MLSSQDKCLVFDTMYRIILHSPKGINTRVLVRKTIDALSTTIPPLNCHHAFGILSYMTRRCDVRFLQKLPGNSIVAF